MPNDDDIEVHRLQDTPTESYPATLTRLLYERFCHFNGAADKGWVLIPCELIDYNGDTRRNMVLRYADLLALTAEFVGWLNDSNTFFSTLVDRIVTGYLRDEVQELQAALGYQDALLDTAEYFYLFVIQGPTWLIEALRLGP